MKALKSGLFGFAAVFLAGVVFGGEPEYKINSAKKVTIDDRLCGVWAQKNQMETKNQKETMMAYTVSSLDSKTYALKSQAFFYQKLKDGKGRWVPGNYVGRTATNISIGSEYKMWLIKIKDQIFLCADSFLVAEITSIDENEVHCRAFKLYTRDIILNGAKDDTELRKVVEENIDPENASIHLVKLTGKDLKMFAGESSSSSVMVSK